MLTMFELLAVSALPPAVRVVVLLVEVALPVVPVLLPDTVPVSWPVVEAPGC